MILTPYERGWLEAYKGKPNDNTYLPGTEDHADYEQGYRDNKSVELDAPKFLGPDFLKDAVA